MDTHELLSTFIPIDRRRALGLGLTLPDRATGAVLFADISGFTPLTQALSEELGKQRGPEELTLLLNGVYNAVIDEIFRYGGSVVGFAGDSITCWFGDDDGSRATTSALALRAAMARFASVTVPGGAAHALSLKTVVVAGAVRRFVVGDPNIQLIDTLAGATLDRMAAGEHLAGRDEVLVDQGIAERLAGRLAITTWRSGPMTGDRFAVVAAISPPAHPDPWPPIPPLAPDVVRPWLLPTVYQQLLSRQERFWAELRPAVPVFVNFAGIDYDDDHAAGKLDATIRWVQSVLSEVDASLLQLTIGDKGSYLYLAFGAPTAHDDDAARAVATAVRLRDISAHLDFITQIQIGIAAGPMRVGSYGADSCRTFGMQGNDVNMAARLMGRAAPGQILVSQRVAERAARRFWFNHLGSIDVKGSRAPVPVSEYGGELGPLADLFDRPLVGRRDELAILRGHLDSARSGSGRVVRIFGPAGAGKSHLVAALLREAESAGWRIGVGAGLSTAQTTPYYPWRSILAEILDLPAPRGRTETDSIAPLAAAISGHIDRINPAWSIRLPLLGDVLGVPIPDNLVTATFDAQLRQQGLLSLVVDLVQTLATSQPVALVLDDAQWLDENSEALAEAIARGIEGSATLLVLVHRSTQSGERVPAPDAAALPHYRSLGLAELSQDEISALVSFRLGAPVTPLVLSLIQAKAQGNAFFAGELADSLCETGLIHLDDSGDWALSEAMIEGLVEMNCLTKVGDAWEFSGNVQMVSSTLGLPETVQGVVLSRIDRLDEEQKVTLKVASVIGRSFGLDPLRASHPARPAAAVLQDHVQTMAHHEFVTLETPTTDDSYTFRHHITQEVAYGTLLFAQRRQLHAAVAEWYEFGLDRAGSQPLTAESPLAPLFPLLAYHWRHAENPQRERTYARLAGEQAARQYANGEAVAYLGRALQLTPEGDAAARFDVLAAREEVLDRLGLRQNQAEDLALLRSLAEALDDDRRRIDIGLRQANLARVTGDYGDAHRLLHEAEALAQACGDARRHARCIALAGRLAAQQDDYRAAETFLARAADMADSVADISLLVVCVYDLATVHYLQGQFEQARLNVERAQHLYAQLSDRRGEINCLRLLGAIDKNQAQRFEDATAHYEEALTLCDQIGWRHGETYLLANIGNLAFDLGDYRSAQRYHDRALAICREVGDREGESVSLDTLGLTAALQGETEKALDLYRQALVLEQAIGYRRGEAFTLTHLAYALIERRDSETDRRTNLDEAEDAFLQALSIRQDISPGSGLTMDNLAGLARVALLRGDLHTALGLARDALTWIQRNGTDGIELPGLTYLICFQVLHAAGDDAAQQILEQGRAEVSQTAAHIRNVDLRRLYLEQVPWNRDLIAGLTEPG